MTPSPHTTGSAAWAETGARLLALGDRLGFHAELPADRRSWVAVSTAVPSGVVDDLAAHLLRKVGQESVAGSYLGTRLAGPLVRRTVAAVVLDHRCPDLDPATVFVHLHEDDWFDEVAFTGTGGAVLAGDPAAGQSGATVLHGTQVALAAWWAEHLVATVTPLFDAARSRLRYGRRGLWGALAANVASTATNVDRKRGGTGAAGWAEAQPLLDALSARAPVPVTRPRPLPVPWSGGTAWFSTKGTCCLFHRTQPDADPTTGTGYCSTCPLVGEACKARRIAARLDDPEAE